MHKLASPSHRTLKLDEILRLVELSNFGLPEFQRQFVWEHDKLRRLLATVFMGWPAGMVLLMEAPPESFFAVRALDDVPGQAPEQFRHLILDGQQRVTALAHAFGIVRSPDRGRWYVDVEKFAELLPGGDVEDSFVKLTREPASPPSQRLIPLSALRSGADFQEWRNHLLRESSTERPGDHWDRSSTDHAWVELLAGVRAFELPCTILPASMPLPAVAMIFERLNTAGIALDTFDLVVAHVYKDGHNLREEWNRALDSRPILRGFAGEDALIAAELISMITTGDTRRAGLLSLDPEQLWSAWPRAISALEDAAQFLADEAGIAKASQLPHRGFLLALAGASYELGGLPARLTPLILHWLYARGLASRFNAAVNTRVVSEYRALVRALREGKLPDATPTAEELSAATRRTNASTWLAFQAMIRRNRPESYPDGLVAVPMPPEWTAPRSLISASNSSISELALGTILGDGGDAQTFRTLGEFRDSLRAFEPDRVDRYLAEQLLPGLESTVWEVPAQFITERARLALAQLAELNQSAQRLFQIDAPTGIGELPRDARAVDRPVPQRLRVRNTFQLADYLIQQGRSHDATSVLQLLLESLDAAPVGELIDAELLLARALVGSGHASQAVHLLRTSLTRIENEQPSAVTDQARGKVMRALVELLHGGGDAKQAIEASRTEWFRYLSDGLSARESTEMLLNYAQSLRASGDREASNRLAHEVLATIEADSLGQWEDLRSRAVMLERESSLPDIAHGMGHDLP